MITIEIPDYIRQIEISKARRKKFFEKGCKLPKKYDNTNYSWKKDATNKTFYLIEDATGERVIKNIRSYGKPRIMVINGQSIYNGMIHKHSRNNMVKCISEFVKPYLKDLKITQFPISIKYEYHDLVRDPISRNQLWDLRNREFPYGKVIEDCMQELGCIPDDDVLHITEISYKFIPINEGEQRKLIIKIL